jgi:hypothetical protein
MVRMIGLGLGAILAVSSLAYGEGPEIKGLIQSQLDSRYDADDGNWDSRFLVKAARLKVSADVTDRIKGTLQVDFARDPLILDAMIDIAVVQYANFRLGQFTIPFGYEFQLSRYDLEAIDRSLIMKTAFGNGVSGPYVRDVGVQLSGRYKLFNYQVAVVNGTGFDYHGHGEEAPVFAGWNQDNNNAKDIVGRIGIGVPMFAGLGFSMYEGSWVCDREKSAMGFYFHIDTGKVVFQYEWLRGEGYLDEAEDDPELASADPPGFAWQELEYGGYYLVVGYRIKPMIQPTFKVDKLDPDRDEDGDGRTDYYYGLNLNLESRARLQLFYRDSQNDGDFIGKGWKAQVSTKF